MRSFTKWFRSPSVPAARKAPKARKPRLAVERLEPREVPVVGAFAVPAPVAAGTGSDGVVELDVPGGSCTGTLLSSGRHVLTAAHCVDNNYPVLPQLSSQLYLGDRVVDGPVTVKFHMPGPHTISLTVPAD